MKTIKYIFLALVLIIPSISYPQSYCDFIQKIQKYQDSVKLKTSGDYNIIDSKTFKLHTYLSFFNKLEVEKDYRIEAYYYDNGLNGNPYLYALKTNEILATRNRKKLYPFLNNPVIKAKSHICPQDSETGFLQYLFFSELGEQFALSWHAYYFQKRILCSFDGLMNVINNLKDSESFSTDSIEMTQANKINPEITIERNEKYYLISWLENRTHMGLFRCTYRIERNSPYSITKINEKRLLSISPNFLY